MDGTEIPQQSRDQIIACIRTAHILVQAYLTEAKKIKQIVWAPSIAQEALLQNARATLSQSYQGIWSNLDQAGRLLAAANVDVEQFWALSSRRRGDYIGYRETDSSFDFDVVELELAGEAAQSLEALFPGTVWEEPMDPEAEAYISKHQSSDSSMTTAMAILGAIGALAWLAYKLSTCL